MMRNECFSDGFFEGQRWANIWTETHGTEYGNTFVDGIKSALTEVTLGYVVDVPVWNEGFVYGARQVARDFVRYGITTVDAVDQTEGIGDVGVDCSEDMSIEDEQRPDVGENQLKQLGSSRLAA
jgi:hypothetical protein